MGQTIVEKIISRHAGRRVEADEIVVVPVDGSLASDTTAPLAIRAFQAMGGVSLRHPERCVLVIDHAAPAPNSRIANLHALMRRFAREQGCVLVEAGEGICHQVMIEQGLVQPGEIIIGADSHTCTYGALGALGTGMGSTDLAGVWLTGKTWLRVPRSSRVVFQGEPCPGLQGKDLILAALARMGIAGATYQCLEFSGPALSGFSLADRLSIANMVIEAGGKAGFVTAEGLDPELARRMDQPDSGAAYEFTTVLDVSRLDPQVSPPHSPDQAVPVGELEGREIHYAFLGTCANGRWEDLRLAARILGGAGVAPGTRLIIAPASRRTFLKALADGTVETLSRAGAGFIPPGCGPCVGTHNGVPADGEVVISSGNRNFLGRMGNPRASVYLASAATVAASARAGRISDPRRYLA